MADNDNIYRAARKAAAEKNPKLRSCESAQSAVNIERTRLLAIENGQKLPNPEDVKRMAEVYGAPELCNHYCSTQCPLGERTPTLISDDLDRISVLLMSSLHALDRVESSVYEILADGRIDESELPELDKIIDTLDRISYSADSLNLWTKKNLGHEPPQKKH